MNNTKKKKKAHMPDLKPLWKLMIMEFNSHAEFRNDINISSTNS